MREKAVATSAAPAPVLEIISSPAVSAVVVRRCASLPTLPQYRAAFAREGRYRHGRLNHFPDNSFVGCRHQGRITTIITNNDESSGRNLTQPKTAAFVCGKTARAREHEGFQTEFQSGFDDA